MPFAVVVATIALIVLGLCGWLLVVYTRPMELWDQTKWPQQTPIPRTRQTPALSDQQQRSIDALVAEIDVKTLRTVEEVAAPVSAGRDNMTAYYDDAHLAKISRRHNSEEKDQTLAIYYNGGKVVYVRVDEAWANTLYSGVRVSRLSMSRHYFVDDGRMATYVEVDGGVVRSEWDDQVIREVESRVREDDALAQRLFARPSAA